MTPTVSVIIPTRNRVDMLETCLESIYSNTYKPHEIIVIDNNSTDNTVELLTQKYPDIIVVKNETNVFATIARNRGMRMASGDYYLLVDDDNRIDSRMIEELVAICESDSSIGIAGPKMYFKEPTNLLLFTGAYIHPITSRAWYRGSGEIDIGQYDAPCETEHIPNIQIIRQEVVDKVGGFDERYRMTFSEADYPMRVAKAGFKVMYCPKAVTWHEAPTPGSVKHIIRSPMRVYYLSRNREVYMKMFSSPLQFLLFITCFFPLFTLYYSYEAIHHKVPGFARMQTLRMHLLGSLHGLIFVLTGKLIEYYDTHE